MAFLRKQGALVLANSAAEYSGLDKGKLLNGVFYKHKVFHNLLYPQGGSL